MKYVKWRLSLRANQSLFTWCKGISGSSSYTLDIWNKIRKFLFLQSLDTWDVLSIKSPQRCRWSKTRNNILLENDVCRSNINAEMFAKCAQAPMRPRNISGLRTFIFIIFCVFLKWDCEMGDNYRYRLPPYSLANRKNASPVRSL